MYRHKHIPNRNNNWSSYTYKLQQIIEKDHGIPRCKNLSIISLNLLSKQYKQVLRGVTERQTVLLTWWVSQRPETDDLAYLGSASRPDMTYLSTTSRPDMTYLSTTSRPDMTYLGTKSRPDMTYLGTTSRPDMTYLGTTSRPDMTYLSTTSRPGRWSLSRWEVQSPSRLNSFSEFKGVLVVLKL